MSRPRRLPSVYRDTPCSRCGGHEYVQGKHNRRCVECSRHRSAQQARERSDDRLPLNLETEADLDSARSLLRRRGDYEDEMWLLMEHLEIPFTEENIAKLNDELAKIASVKRKA